MTIVGNPGRNLKELVTTLRNAKTTPLNNPLRTEPQAARILNLMPFAATR